MTADSDSLIEIREVFKTYTMGEVDVPVLKGVDLAIRQGEMLTILGESGSGKSTLMNMIGGIDRVDRGALLFAGEDIATYSEMQLTAYRRDKVGFVFQFYNLVPRTALFRGQDGQWQSFKIDRGQAQRVTVTIGLMNDYQAEILSGLQPGERVIVAPESTLSAGTKVASSAP